MKKIDVAIIGAGSGGLSARREVAKVTDNYLVFDDGPLGTTCARVGCMPSKVLIQVANDFYRRFKFAEEGIHGADALSMNSKEVMTHVRKLRDRFVRGVTGSMESWTGEKLVRERVKFLDANTLEAAGEKYQADKIVIATGSTPVIPAQFKGYEKYLITTDQVFEMEELPKAMAVIGLGVIGIELGQALHRLGIDVLAIARRRMIAGVSDPDILEYVTRKLAEEMNISYTGVEEVKEENGQLHLKTDGKWTAVDRVLMTAGRSANLESLNLSCLDLEYNEKNHPKYNDETFQLLGQDHLFIAGDITGTKQLLHEASDEGKIAGFNAVNPIVKYKTRCPIEVTFSDPNIAFIGQKYLELKAAGTAFETGEVTFEGQGRSIVKLKEVGLLHVYGDKKTGKLLGAELFAPEGEHLAHLLSWVISQGLTVNEVLALPFYHPVIEEGLRTALRDLRDKVDEQSPNLETYPL